jgi:hypothetical protein
MVSVKGSQVVLRASEVVLVLATRNMISQCCSKSILTYLLRKPSPRRQPIPTQLFPSQLIPVAAQYVICFDVVKHSSVSSDLCFVLGMSLLLLLLRSRPVRSWAESPSFPRQLVLLPL